MNQYWRAATTEFFDGSPEHEALPKIVEALQHAAKHLNEILPSHTINFTMGEIDFANSRAIGIKIVERGD